ncbi:MAG: thioredoxin family protein [Gammaproteobacteria bacterium]
MRTVRLTTRLFAAVRARLWVYVGAAALVGVTVLALEQSSDDAVFYKRWGFDATNLPYKADVDARMAVEAGKARAAESGKMLMVTFGANWCPDCLTLQKNLRDPETHAYAERNFEMVNVDVGDSAKSARVERDLGMTVNTIPLAMFYSADGKPICDTQRGELKPSRHYSSREILGFLREVVDYRRAVSPDQRQ